MIEQAIDAVDLVGSEVKVTRLVVCVKAMNHEAVLRFFKGPSSS
jgi:hypothetical protein